MSKVDSRLSNDSCRVGIHRQEGGLNDYEGLTNGAVAVEELAPSCGLGCASAAARFCCSCPHG
jgi:hypothetical protein